MKRLFIKFWPALFIIGVWSLFSAPYFFQGMVPFPSKYQMNAYAPWNEYGVYQGPIKNGAMPDLITQIYPWKHFTIESLKSGQLPLWNPYSFSGTPHLANYQSAIFSPFNLLYFVLPFLDAWSLIVLLQPLLAGLFMYLFLRQLKISEIGSLIGSVAFMFSGFIVTWMAYGTLGYAILWLPMMLLAIEKIFELSKHDVRSGKWEARKMRWEIGSLTSNFRNLASHLKHLTSSWGLDIRIFGWGLIAALSLACSFFSGHIQISVYFAMYVLAYLVFKGFATRDIRAFLFVGVFYLIGVGIALVQILPTLELYKLASRSQWFMNLGAIPVQYLATVVAPDFFGNPVTRNDWFGYYAEWASFIGIVPFVFATIAAFAKPNRTKLFFLFAGIIALILTLDTPLQQVIASLKLPIFSTSIPSRMIILFSFSFAVLAAFGFDVFKHAKSVNRHIVTPLVLLVFAVGSVWLALFVFHMLPQDKVMLAARNFVIPSALFFVTVAIIVLSLRFPKKHVPVIAGIVLLLLSAGDSMRFAQKWMPFDPREYVFPDVPVVAAMQKQIGDGRVYGDFGAFVDTYYRLPSIDGYDPLFIQRYGEFIQSASEGEFVNAQKNVVSLNKRGKYTERVLDLLGVTMILHPVSRTQQNWAFPVWEDSERYVKYYEDEKFELYRNTEALPRAKLFYNYEVIQDDKAIIKRFYSEEFDFRNVLILEETPKIISNFKFQISNFKDNSKVVITSYTPNKVIISVLTDKPGLLFLSDSYYPAWKVTVNGKEEKIYRADYAFRAVVVPAGKSEVEFSL